MRCIVKNHSDIRRLLSYFERIIKILLDRKWIWLFIINIFYWLIWFFEMKPQYALNIYTMPIYEIISDRIHF